MLRWLGGAIRRAAARARARAAAPAAPPRPHPPPVEKTSHFCLKFPPCFSRACLGKCALGFKQQCQKTARKRRFRTASSSPALTAAGAGLDIAPPPYRKAHLLFSVFPMFAPSLSWQNDVYCSFVLSSKKWREKGGFLSHLYFKDLFQKKAFSAPAEHPLGTGRRARAAAPARRASWPAGRSAARRTASSPLASPPSLLLPPQWPGPGAGRWWWLTERECPASAECTAQTQTDQPASDKPSLYCERFPSMLCQDRLGPSTKFKARRFRVPIPSWKRCREERFALRI